MAAYANVDGESCLHVEFHVPNIGPWWADVIFETSPDVSGAVVLSLGALQLNGTISPSEDGTFGAQRRSRIVGGAGGWATLVPAQHYHSDAGVSALVVAQDAARLAGETLGAFAPEVPSIGIDYVREAGLAARVLEDVIGAVPWFVGYDGVTVVGSRTTTNPTAADYQVLDFDPRENLVSLAIDDLLKVGIGSVLTEGLDAPVTVFELEVIVDPEKSRTTAWAGGSAGGRSRLVDLFRGMVRRSVDGQLFGKYRYRVVKLSGDRVELQAVVQAAGVPDILPISMRPGVAGAHAKLAAGSLVLVEFIEGNRTLPIVTGFAGKGDSGHEPTELDFSVLTTMRLGSGSASEGLTLGDSHKAWADGHTHSQGTLTAPSGGGQVTGVSGAPVTTAPATSGKVFAE